MTLCRICGFDGPDVRPAVAQWAAPHDGVTWEAVQRCPDRDACAGRVLVAGRVWPLVEAQTPVPTTTRRSQADADAELAAWREKRKTLVADRLMDPRPPKVDPDTGRYVFRDPLPLPQLPLPEPDPTPPPKPTPPPSHDPSSWW